MSKIPDYLIRHVKDDRPKRLVNRVWRRLPAYDRHVLRELLCEISDNQENPEYVLGSAGIVEPDTFIVGCAAQVAEDLSYMISLAGAKGIESDAACMFVIAHEFAHIVLRHAEMTAVVAVLLGWEPEPIYTDDGMSTLREWHEDHAHLQAWLWGFQDEFKAYLDTCPEARRPRWYVETEDA
jgi:hypothetical protein